MGRETGHTNGMALCKVEGARKWAGQTAACFQWFGTSSRATCSPSHPGCDAECPGAVSGGGICMHGFGRGKCGIPPTPRGGEGLAIAYHQ